MKKLNLCNLFVVILASLLPALSAASPKDDLDKFRNFFFQKFPGTTMQEYADGIYGIDKARRDEWLAMEEFPPYEPGVELGKEYFEKYNVGSCFPNGGIGIRQNYPLFNADTGEVQTLEGDIMNCLVKNGVDLKQEKISFNKGKLAAIAAYMAYTSRGKKINVVVPNDERALKIYNRGKWHFYAKRGQMNFSCADCHMHYAGQMVRTNLLSPALGHVSHFPAYRKKWEAGGGHPSLAGFGTLQRRYGGCNKQVRAKPFKGKDGKQHPEYIALEYFHTYMSNGIQINAPGIRQ